MSCLSSRLFAEALCAGALQIARRLVGVSRRPFEMISKFAVKRNHYVVFFEDAGRPLPFGQHLKGEIENKFDFFCLYVLKKKNAKILTTLQFN